jgi:uncharacterized protein (TIGR02246 family)
MAMTTDLSAAIAAGNEKFMAAARQGDAAAVAALYTDSGQVLPPNAGVMSGREAIQAFFQAMLNMGIQGIQLDSTEVADHGDTAIEVGRYTLFGEGSQQLDQGKYIVVWKQEAGDWKLHRDIFNSSMPAPGA